MLFRNHYTCPQCAQDWTDDWDCMVDNDCPNCGKRHISPRHSEDLPNGKERIRRLNDFLRTNFVGGAVVVTDAFATLPTDTKAAVLEKIRAFDDFHMGNDPHGEHDFVAVEHEGRSFFARIDYYDKAMEYGSPDPSNPDVTTRVLTIMLASDY